MTPSSHGGIEEIVAQESDAKQLPDSNAKLAQENTALKGNIYEERLLWLIIVAVIFDSFVFTYMDNWGGPIAILILEIIAILILANRWEVQEVKNLFNKVLYWRR